MDNNKKVELNKLEYENMHTIQKINSISMNKNQIDMRTGSEFKNVMKNVAKKKKKIFKDTLNDDIVVENSLKELISEDNEIKRTVEEKIISSRIIKEVLSKNKEEEITPSDILKSI